MKLLEDFATTKYNIFLFDLKQKKKQTQQAGTTAAMGQVAPSITTGGSDTGDSGTGGMGGAGPGEGGY